jgi:thiol-disulfide isomerase/thioredoxin
MKCITWIVVFLLYNSTYSKTIIVHSKEDLTFSFEYGKTEDIKEFNKSKSIYSLTVPDSVDIGTVSVNFNQNQQQYGFVIPLLLDTVSLRFDKNKFTYIHTDSLTKYLSLGIIDLQNNNDLDGMKKLIFNSLEKYPDHPINLLLLQASLSLFDYENKRKALDLVLKSELLNSYQGKKIHQAFLSSLKLQPGQEFPVVDDLVLVRGANKLTDVTESDVIYAFSASWCGPCIKSIPTLNEISEREQYDVFIINIDKRTELSESYLNSYHQSIGIYNLQPDLLLSNYGFSNIPQYILCKDDKIVEISNDIKSLIVK